MSIPVVALAVLGCGNGDPMDSPQADPPIGTPAEPAAAAAIAGRDPTQSNAAYEHMLEVIVAGTKPDSTEEQFDALEPVVAAAEQFSEEQRRGYIRFLQTKIDASSPWVRMKAAAEIGWQRQELGESSKSTDLIPLFCELLSHEDPWVGYAALQDVESILTGSTPHSHAEPLVKAIVPLIDDAKADYAAIKILPRLGPHAKAALPKLRRAELRSDDETLKTAVSEAISKI
ncbi:MAG: hypothetical protein AAGJ46_13680 [Planctomycetota bacterium]